MIPELAYFIKVNVAIMLFYLFYRSFCTQDTFFRWQRITLLGFWCIAWIYPLMDLQNWIHQQAPMQELATFYAQTLYIAPSTELNEETGIQWEKWGLVLYFTGVILLGLRFLIQLSGICRLAWKCRTEKIAQTRIRILCKKGGPFSFFQWIFIHPDSLKNPHEAEEILAHEQTHAREWHSIDILFSELNCILCWINPFCWLLKREIRNNLEYLADRQVITSGHDTKSYQYHLLGLAHQKAAATLYNHFNVLPIKKRIMMMNKKRTRNIGRTKYCMFFLLATVLMLLSNIESVARNTEKVYTTLTESFSGPKNPEIITSITKETTTDLSSQKEGPLFVLDGKKINKKADFDPSTASEEQYAKFLGVKAEEIESITVLKDEAAVKAWGKEGKNGVIQFTIKKEDPDKIYEIVEEQPSWKEGGINGMYKYLSDNLIYPETSQKEGVQGKVFVRFVVEKDGSITNPTIVRSLSPETDKEVIRLTQTMPKWNPGKMKGEVVRAYFVLPIHFRLK